MSSISREASESDFAIVQRIVDANQQFFNPNEISVGESEARELVRGYFDPAISRILKSSEEADWECFISLHPDKSRERLYLEMFRTPGSALLQEGLELAISWAVESFNTFRIWVGLQASDDEYRALLEENGYSLLRRYWAMQMNLASAPAIELANGMELIEVGDDGALLFEMWQIHQDSFSEHFGFMPRAFEEWSAKLIRDIEEFGQRCWILRVNGEGVGFVDTDDHLLHDKSGFVAGLGVRKAHQGNGYGELLLRFAIRSQYDLGREKLTLSVDAGNESGALRLYEKVGMNVHSEWHHYENPNWARA